MILAALILATTPLSTPRTLEPVLAAIQTVETGGEPRGGADATGDAGRSIGPLQIQRAYWIDSGVPGRYEECRDIGYARTVAHAYWKRWCPEALERLDFETLARVHNGGPRGNQKTSTLKYWTNVRTQLERKDGCAPAPPPASGPPPAVVR